MTIGANAIRRGNRPRLRPMRRGINRPRGPFFDQPLRIARIGADVARADAVDGVWRWPVFGHRRIAKASNPSNSPVSLVPCHIAPARGDATQKTDRCRRSVLSRCCRNRSRIRPDGPTRLRLCLPIPSRRWRTWCRRCCPRGVVACRRFHGERSTWAKSERVSATMSVRATRIKHLNQFCTEQPRCQCIQREACQPIRDD